MNTELNKKQKRRYIDAFNSANLNAIDELFAEDYVLHIEGSQDIKGAKILKKMVAESLATLSEASFSINDMVAEGDKVVTRWTLTAIHSGDFMGVPPTGNRLKMNGIIIDRFIDGKVVEAWEAYDMYGLMKQLGQISGN